MARTEIPFNDWSKDKLKKERKNATSRTKRYGEPGDTFVVRIDEDNLWKYGINHVEKVSLWKVAYVYFIAEGCKTPKEFREVWRDIHPRKGFDPEQEVWTHFFEKIEENVEGER